MLVIRDIMNCKPGRVRPMIERFKAMQKITKQKGLLKFRILTDVSGDPFWTIILETEVKSLEQFEKDGQKMMGDKKLGKLMQGYHDDVVSGRREIFKLEE